MGVGLNVPLDILVASLTNITVRVPKDVVHTTSSESMASITDPEKVRKERRHTAATVQVTWIPPVQKRERANDSNINEEWRNTISISPEYALYRTRFINMLKKFPEMWAGNLGQIITGMRKADLLPPGDRLIHDKPYCTGPKAGKTEEDKSGKMLAIKVIESMQIERASTFVFVPK